MAGTSKAQPFFELLKTPELADLGPGPRQGVASKASLGSKLQAIFDKSKISPDRQELIRALLLLWHDHHDEAHMIVQNFENGDGAFIHGIVHRREPDYWNSKYWFRRVGKLPAFNLIAEQAGQVLQKTNSAINAQLLPGGVWDPLGFIDACETASQKSADDPQTTLLREIQKIETQCLLEHLCS